MATAKKKTTKKVSKKVAAVKKTVVNPLGVKFETGIEVPSRGGEFHRRVYTTLNLMSVGESFLFIASTPTEDHRFQGAISLYRKKEKTYEQGKDFCSRKVEGGRRVWRLT